MAPNAKRSQLTTPSRYQRSPFDALVFNCKCAVAFFMMSTSWAWSSTAMPPPTPMVMAEAPPMLLVVPPMLLVVPPMLPVAEEVSEAAEADCATPSSTNHTACTYMASKSTLPHG